MNEFVPRVMTSKKEIELLKKQLNVEKKKNANLEAKYEKAVRELGYAKDEVERVSRLNRGLRDQLRELNSRNVFSEPEPRRRSRW